jgi:glutamine amidotransferase
MQRIALVDLGMGNLRSVERALAQGAVDASVACEVERTSDPERVRGADKIVVPGQGAFRDCSSCLGRGIGEVLRERIAAGVPYLGICLGLHALFEESEEAPGQPGLGVLRGRVRKLSPGDGYKIPHMGWNQVAESQAAGPHAPFAGEAPYFYFVHSYHAVPEDSALIAAVTHHGPHTITAAVKHENVTGTQFHPEKSQVAGLRLMAAFVARG